MSEWENKPEQEVRETMDKVLAMSDAEFSSFMLASFQRSCREPLPANKEEKS